MFLHLQRKEGEDVKDSRYNMAKEYIDRQLAVARRHGKSARLSPSEYKALVGRVVRATPRVSRNRSDKIRSHG